VTGKLNAVTGPALFISATLELGIGLKPKTLDLLGRKGVAYTAMTYTQSY
jgi:hypothetical protein